MKLCTLLCILVALLGCQTTSKEKQALYDIELAKTNFTQKNYAASAEILRPLAAQGNSAAQYALGYQYFYGLGVTKDTETGTQWIRLAAAQQLPAAQQALALINDQKQTFEPLDGLTN